MLNPTELDPRVLNHAARIAYADRLGALCPAPRSARGGPRRFVAALLLRLSLRLATEQGQRIVSGDAAA